MGEQLDNVISWRCDFFTHGHSMDEIDDMSYWDLIEVSKYQNQNAPKGSGQTTYKELKPSQKKMIKERKERERIRKEGIK